MNGERIESIQLARHYLSAGFRCSIVQMVTGLPAVRVRDLHELVHGARPKSGQLKSGATIVESNLARANASVLMAVYSRLAANHKQSVDYDAIIRTLELIDQTGLAKRNRLGVNELWTLARDLRSGSASLEKCSRCGRQHLFVSQMRLAGCPYNCPSSR